jgi:mannosyltransferase
MTIKRLQPNRQSIDSQTLYRWLPITLILIAATALFTYRLGYEGLWIDEFFSIRDSAGSLLEIYQGNQLRPLYYLLLAGWRQLGSSDTWMRSLSVIFAVVSVFLIYRLGRRVAGEAEGLTAAMLLATSPLFVSHTQEIRMYVVSLCLGLAGTLFLADALLVERSEQPDQRSLAGWSLFRLLAIYTVPLNLMLLLPDVILIFLRFRQERAVLFSFAKWLLLLFVLWSPSTLSVFQEADPNSAYADERADFSRPPGLGNLVYPLKFWMVWPFVVKGSAIAHQFYKAFTLLVAGLVAAGLWYKRRSPALLWTLAWFILPLLPIVAFSRVSAQIWEPRYVLFASPYLFILIAAGFTRLWRQWKPAAIVAILLYSLAIGGALFNYYTVQNRADYRAIVDTIEQREQPGDTIIWGEGWHEPLLHYYDGDATIYWRKMTTIETAEAIQPWIGQLPTEHERQWLVMRDAKSLTKDFERALENGYRVEENIEFEHRSRLLLLTPLKQPSAQVPAQVLPQ